MTKVIPVSVEVRAGQPVLPLYVAYQVPPGSHLPQNSPSFKVLIDEKDKDLVKKWKSPPPCDHKTQRRDWRPDRGDWEVWNPDEYASLRAAAYPPLADLADALVTLSDPATHADGKAQYDRYTAACLAVKARYPKPTPAPGA